MFPVYNFQAHCPKCQHKDVSTQYVKSGGRYGQPCEFAPKQLAESEHMHRHCRRCGYEWCEACLETAPRFKVIPVEQLDQPYTVEETVNKEIVKVENELAKLRELGQFLDGSNFAWRFRKYAAAYKEVLTRYARFKISDRVQLAQTPNITAENAPGWLGSKHFLVKGAKGTVVSSDFREGGGMWYGIAFDDESWRDDRGVIHPIENQHEYGFGEEWITADGEGDTA